VLDEGAFDLRILVIPIAYHSYPPYPNGKRTTTSARPSRETHAVKPG
jgi:hypothetical protein